MLICFSCMTIIQSCLYPYRPYPYVPIPVPHTQNALKAGAGVPSALNFLETQAVAMTPKATLVQPQAPYIAFRAKEFREMGIIGKPSKRAPFLGQYSIPYTFNPIPKPVCPIIVVTSATCITTTMNNNS